MEEHAYAIETWHSGFEQDGHPSECWLWKGNLNAKSGYGQARHSLYPNTVPAHRLIFELIHGKLPDHLDCDHLCGIRSCVRPEHLEPVSPAENTHRSRNVCSLDWPRVRAIRSSSLSHAELAERFGVDPSTISRVRAGRTWIEPDAT
jgi:hypothetical protein